MTAVPIPDRDRARVLAGPMASRDRNGGRTPRPIAFAATLVLAALTGLPLASVANLIPQPDDPSDPFLGL
ncbi:hypothetical protein [Methylobacterium goesingense]|uniref:Uncharacterized protein n=1 Tax=Methylobacterium goesingense TaxID=243690 RepID=A0ABV2LAR0_9HYPH|nr:hypothetical protein [Methylobacterium goesingense]GJD72129.1 hypothetical protein CFIICLFH_0340 [Methylobacterium goesingense]